MTIPRRVALSSILGLGAAAVTGAALSACAPDVSDSSPSGSASAPGRPTDTSPAATTSSATPTPSSLVQLSSNIEDRATGVAVDTVLQLTAAQGVLQQVSASATVTDTKGNPEQVSLSGALAKDGATWTASEGLDPGATYTIKVLAKDASELPATFTRSFTTQKLSLKQQTFPSVFPLDGMTVGIAMAAIITFDVPIATAQRANIEKHLTVTTSPAQEGSWYWQSEDQLHYRPKNYWKPGTKVTVDARLNGVKAGKDLYGQKSRQFSFTVGRAVVARTDLQAKVTRVYIGGKLARSIPISAGKTGFITRSGTKVVMEKLRRTPMRSETADLTDPEYYNLANVEYAVRLTNSGEFFHAAPWNAKNFGKVNSSHGCTGMSLADAAWLFDNVNVGDPAEFFGSNRPMEIGNGYTDWNLTWDDVTNRSAVH